MLYRSMGRKKWPRLRKSACYEFIEWWVALIIGAPVVLARVQDRQLERL
ncbi:MAG: hypothetical protein IIA76_01025 [Proteobacteria bacterium]|nr:hypothetical protein [Pseudomonadota bacterium]MCH8929493.1 hypothetical protein [Pseudomonadota bacterium]